MPQHCITTHPASPCRGLPRLHTAQANEALLCGRVLVFLARALPLFDKSGVNQSGNINERLLLSLDEVAEGAVDTNGQPIDGAFYRTFWGLQAQLAVGVGLGMVQPGCLIGSNWAAAGLP
jgi:hypothetical protein